MVGTGGIVSAAKNGIVLDKVSIRLNNATKEPIVVLFNKHSLQVDDIYMAFDTMESEALFLQDLYFALEEYNNIPERSRITSGKKEVTVDQLLAEARRDIKNTSGEKDGEK